MSKMERCYDCGRRLGSMNLFAGSLFSKLSDWDQ